MDKKTIIGFVLIAFVFIAFSWWNRPSAEQIRQQQIQDSIAQVNKEKAEKELADKAKSEKEKEAEKAKEALKDTTAIFHSAMSGTDAPIVLKNQKVELTLGTKGGTVNKVVIKNYEDRADNKDLTLFEGNDQQLKFMLAGKDMNINTADMFFTPSEQTDTTVTLTATAANGKTLELKDLLETMITRLDCTSTCRVRTAPVCGKIKASSGYCICFRIGSYFNGRKAVLSGSLCLSKGQIFLSTNSSLACARSNENSYVGSILRGRE